MNTKAIIAAVLAALVLSAGAATALPGNAPDGVGADEAGQADEHADDADDNADDAAQDAAEGIDTASTRPSVFPVATDGTSMTRVEMECRVRSEA
jgi:hypothetical protein